mgnify:CR=1 FL=1
MDKIHEQIEAIHAKNKETEKKIDEVYNRMWEDQPVTKKELVELAEVIQRSLNNFAELIDKNFDLASKNFTEIENRLIELEKTKEDEPQE